MNRTKFYNKVTNNGIDELDFLDNSLSKFSIKSTPNYVRTREYHPQRADILSYEGYGSVRFWWLLMLDNGILNPLEDIEVGVRFRIPNRIDVYDFYAKFSLRS